MNPDWLPCLAPTDGVWEDVVEKLHSIFDLDFVRGSPTVGGKPIRWDAHMEDGFEACFWHLISRTDRNTGERLFDPRRAERLPWCAALMRHFNEPAVKAWRYVEGNRRVRLYIWFEEGDYVVVLEERTRSTASALFLVTAYHVDGPATRRSLEKKYQNRLP